MTSRRACVALLAAVTFAAGACGSAHQTKTTSSTASTSSPTAPGPSTSFAGSTTETSASGTATTPATLTAFRHALQSGVERLVFEFQATTPDYDVHYVSGHGVTKPSGQLATVGGDAAIQIGFHPAQAHDDQGHATVMGSQPVVIHEGSVVEIVIAEDFEGYVNFALGVTGHPAFHVLVLNGPPRIVIDVGPAGS